MTTTLQALALRLADLAPTGEWRKLAGDLLWVALRSDDITYADIYDELLAGCQPPDCILRYVMVTEPLETGRLRMSIENMLHGMPRSNPDHGKLFIMAEAALGRLLALELTRRGTTAAPATATPMAVPHRRLFAGLRKHLATMRMPWQR